MYSWGHQRLNHFKDVNMTEFLSNSPNQSQDLSHISEDLSFFNYKIHNKSNHKIYLNLLQESLLSGLILLASRISIFFAFIEISQIKIASTYQSLQFSIFFGTFCFMEFISGYTAGLSCVLGRSLQARDWKGVKRFINMTFIQFGVLSTILCIACITLCSTSHYLFELEDKLDLSVKQTILMLGFSTCCYCFTMIHRNIFLADGFLASGVLCELFSMMYTKLLVGGNNHYLK